MSVENGSEVKKSPLELDEYEANGASLLEAPALQELLARAEMAQAEDAMVASRFRRAFDPFEELTPEAIDGWLRHELGEPYHGGVRVVEEYVGSGSDKDVFRYGELAVKLVKPSAVRSFDEQVHPLLVGQELDDLEQLVATDRRHGIIITQFLPGDPLPRIPGRRLLGMKKAHLTRLDATLEHMRERGLHPHNLGGVLYSPTHGIKFADYVIDEPGHELINRGDIRSTREFLVFILHDHAKFAEFNRLKAHGLNIPGSWYATTGLRGIAMSLILKRFDAMHEKVSQ